MALIILPFRSSNDAVEQASQTTFGVSYESSPVAGVELTIYYVIKRTNNAVLDNEKFFRQCQLALIDHYFFSQNKFSIKAFYLRYKFSQLCIEVQKVVRHAAENDGGENLF